MTRPQIFLDFDGVLNVFPDSYQPTPIDYDLGFTPDCKQRVTLPEGRFTIHWSSVLTNRLYALSDQANLFWLSTWQPETHILNQLLNWSPEKITTVTWYDPISRKGIWTGKRDHIRNTITKNDPTPIVWVDDEECITIAQQQLAGMHPTAPILMIRPDPRIGISQRQLALINQFTTNPNQFTGVQLDAETPNLFEPRNHLGF